MSDPSDESKDDRIRKAIRLNGVQRYLSGAAGAVLLFVSCRALLDDTDGIGVLALVLVAAIFALIAVVGVLPTRFESGDQAVEIYDEEPLRQQLEAAADVMTTEQLEEAASLAERGSARVRKWTQLEDVAVAQKEPMGWGLRTLADFERHGRMYLTEACARLGAQVEFEVPMPDGSRADAVVTHGATRIIVDFKWRLKVRDVNGASARAMSASPDAQVLLIAGEGPNTQSLVEFLKANAKVRVALMEPSSITTVLSEMIRAPQATESSE